MRDSVLNYSAVKSKLYLINNFKKREPQTQLVLDWPSKQRPCGGEGCVSRVSDYVTVTGKKAQLCFDTQEKPRCRGGNAKDRFGHGGPQSLSRRCALFCSAGQGSDGGS